jgi:diguanylate cyclase (GGDEF)-like protein/PAS domain S-box-containing protein
MDVRKKMVLIVTASILLTAVPGATLIYGYAQRSILANESVVLENATAGFTASVMQRLAQGEPKLASLAHILEKELAKSIQPGEIEAFHKIMERNSDGVWRNRRQGYDGRYEAGVFLPPNAQEGDVQKVRHLRIKHIMDTFGAAASKPLENVWYLSPHRSEIIFDRTFPDFAFDQKADNDYTQTPWVTYTSPQLNPKREFRFTPPLFDPVPKVWMVSALYPLYVDGRWIGTLGEDMQLTSVLEAMFSNRQLYRGTQHFLLDAQGNYVLAGPWQKQLESTPEAFRLDLSREPQLAALLKQPLTDASHTFSDEVVVQGKRYVAIGMEMEPLRWKYYRLEPVDEVMAPTRRLFYALGGMILLVTGLTGMMIGTAIGTSITRRIKLLSEVMKGYASDHRHRATEQLGGGDEISEVAHVFDEMADDINRGIADRQEAESALKESEELWRFALEGAGDGVWDWDVASNKVTFSRRWKEMIGYAENEIKDNFDEFEKRLHPEDRGQVLAQVQGYFAGRIPIYAVEFRLLCKDGSYKWILARGMVVNRDTEGKPLGMVGTHTDITERKEVEQQLRISATAFESQEGMLVTDANNVILRVNRAFTNITGYSADEAVGQTPRLLKSGQHDAPYYTDMWESLNIRGVWEGEIWNQRKNGEIYPQYLTITAVKDPGGVVTNYVATINDITLRKAAAEEIQTLAFYDPLTKLPNRRLLLDRLRQALAANVRSGKDGALLFIDLDNFKTLNDTLGHDIGDLLLQQVAQRLINCVREDDTVARLGGDEFVIILEDLSVQALDAARQAEVVGDKIQTVLNEPYQLATHEYHITPSIGATLFQAHKEGVDELLKQADIAMYQAKKAGRNAMRFFDPHMQASITARADLERELRVALDKQQFELYYQIQVDYFNRPLGAEVLIRWNHPKHGLVSPLLFIEIAEDTGIILPLGQWVLETACAQLRQWQQNEFTRELMLSVNVSAKQFRQAGFAAKVQSIIEQYGVNPGLLKLELTESMLLDSIEDTIATMTALQAIGVRFSLDDFGTGYSSLQYLKQLPLAQLKIDQSFVREIGGSGSDRAIVRTIIAMAQSLDLDLIAEGVETEEQREILLESGCTNYQGYLFGRPVPIEQFGESLKQD